MNSKRPIVIVALFLGCALLFVVKPRMDISLDYQALVADSPPLVFTKAGDTEISEIERRSIEWTDYTDDAAKYLYGDLPPFSAEMHPLDGFIYLMTHEAPRLSFWKPESNRKAIILLTLRAVLSPTVSGDGAIYFEGNPKGPSRVFTMRSNSSVILNRGSEKIRILTAKDRNENEPIRVPATD